jgi:DASH complex subunit DAD2
MASSKCPVVALPVNLAQVSHVDAAKLPQPKGEEDPDVEKKPESDLPLPQTLVRIPTQHAPALVQQSTSGSVAD